MHSNTMKTRRLQAAPSHAHIAASYIQGPNLGSVNLKLTLPALSFCSLFPNENLLLPQVLFCLWLPLAVVSWPCLLFAIGRRRPFTTSPSAVVRTAITVGLQAQIKYKRGMCEASACLALCHVPTKASCTMIACSPR